MPVTVTSGLFPVAQLPAAQLVRVRVYLINLETETQTVDVTVYKLIGTSKEPILTQEVQVEGGERQVIELETDVVEGETLEVVALLPTNGFVEGQSGVLPGVAIVSIFTGDQSVSLLQAISEDEFVPVPGI